VRAPHLLTRLEDSLVFGDEQSAHAGSRHDAFQACVRSFWYHAGSSGFALEGNSTSENVWNPLREWEDCAFVSATAERLAGNFSNFATPHTLRFRRLLYLQRRPWSASHGPLGIPFEPLARIDLSGALLSTESPGLATFDAHHPGGTVENVCFESTADPLAAFGAYASASTRTFPALGPDVSDDPTVAALAADPADGDPCAAGRPLALGLAQVGVAHVLLGDFAVRQLHPIYTSRPGLVRVASEVALPP
jgi:hypothetical protein